MRFPDNKYATWVMFKTEFLSVFRSQNVTDEARLQLTQIQQGSQDVVAFNTKFQILTI